MGFGNGKYLTIWEVKQKTKGDGTPMPGWVDVRGSTSTKKSDGSFETDWSGFFTVSDSVNGNYATQLLSLKPSAEHKWLTKIKLGDVDVKQRNIQKDGAWVTYTNYRAFGFQFADDSGQGQTRQKPQRPEPAGFINVPDSVIDEELPFL